VRYHVSGSRILNAPSDWKAMESSDRYAIEREEFKLSAAVMPNCAQRRSHPALRATSANHFGGGKIPGRIACLNLGLQTGGMRIAPCSARMKVEAVRPASTVHDTYVSAGYASHPTAMPATGPHSTTARSQHPAPINSRDEWQDSAHS